MHSGRFREVRLVTKLRHPNVAPRWRDQLSLSLSLSAHCRAAGSPAADENARAASAVPMYVLSPGSNFQSGRVLDSNSAS